MNSRFIPIAAFIVWSLVCWYWYVCGIKEQCGTAEATSTQAIQPVAQVPAIPDTAGTAAAQNAIQPVTAPSASTSVSTPSVQKELSGDIESAQVVEVADRVLIHFPYGSARPVDDKAIGPYLSELAQSLVNSGGKVTLIGYSDAIGDPASNKAMSQQRANHIKNTLVKKGVNKSQITVKAMGESRPIATNDNPQGRYKNRRVEVRLGQ